MSYKFTPMLATFVPHSAIYSQFLATDKGLQRMNLARLEAHAETSGSTRSAEDFFHIFGDTLIYHSADFDLANGGAE